MKNTDQTQNETIMSRRQFLRGGKIDSDLIMRIAGASLVVSAIGTIATVGVQYLEHSEEPNYSTLRYRRIPVDQIFRDHDGYRLYYSDNNGKVIETKYLNSGNCCHEFRGSLDVSPEIRAHFRELPNGEKNQASVVIYQDLDADTRGFADAIEFKTNYGSCINIVEVHMPRNSKLSPGNETYGGKFHIPSNMSEVTSGGKAK